VSSCKLFHAFLLLDEKPPLTEQGTYFVSLESIQNSNDFLSAPNGTCPMFQYNYQNATSRLMCENQCRSDRISNGYIWDEKNGQCSLINMTFFEYCPDPPPGDFMIGYSDFVYFPGGRIVPYGSHQSDAVEFARDIPSLVYCETLCSAHKGCHALSYTITTRMCTLLSSCATPEKLGLNKVSTHLLICDDFGSFTYT
jgi:hypothetical protein